MKAFAEVVLVLLLCGSPFHTHCIAGVVPRKGDMSLVDGGEATLTRVDTRPFVESDYTKRFRLDSWTNPKLKELRERYKLDEVVAPGRDEFDKQVLLMDWVHRQFKKFG